MATSGRAEGMTPLCLAESVTAKDRKALTKACAGGKPTHIFGCSEIDREMIGFKKLSEQPIEISFCPGRPISSPFNNQSNR